jgi:hypothetical protein
MTGWSEDSFLEKVAPLLGPRFGAVPCPEVAAFSALADGETSEIVKKAIAAHTLGCPACGDLQRCLERFDDPMVAGDDAEWNRTEKRLNNWLDGFLASNAAVRQEVDRIGASRLRLWWNGLATPTAVRRLRWVLVPAVAAALVISSFLAGRLSLRRSQQVSAEAMSFRQLRAIMAPPPAVLKQPVPKAKATGKPQRSGPPRIQATPGAGIAIASRAPGSIGPPATSPTAPPESARAAEAAAPAPVAPSSSDVASISSPAEMPAAPAPAAASPVYPEPLRALSSRRAALAGHGLSKTAGFATAPEASAEHAPATPAPPLITFEPGTRVWIALESVRPRADGASDFRGRVLLPVTQSGAVLLSRNVEVSGTTTARNGKRSVQILEFLSTGAHYRLKGASGEANLRLLGAGEAVEFDAGRVVETWMASVSIYEKLPGESTQPEK